MRIFTSYSVRIKHYNKIFGKTADLYRKAVDFFIGVILSVWDDMEALEYQNQKYNLVERLTVKTKNNPSPKYDFSKDFYKFPAYLRRAAIAKAYGLASSYKSNLANWEADPKGKRPRKPCAGNTFPVLYRDGCFKPIDGDKYSCEIKVYIRNTWDWVAVELRKSDVDYIERHCANRVEKAPSLVRHGKRWSLSFPFEERVELIDTVNTILAVDLGINNACTCSAMTPDGTILGREFLKLPREQKTL